MVARTDELSRSHRKVILLTDWDRKGVQLHDRLRRLLSDAQVDAEDFFWRRLKRLCGSGSRTVEDLPPFMEALRDQTGGKG